MSEELPIFDPLHKVDYGDRLCMVRNIARYRRKDVSEKFPIRFEPSFDDVPRFGEFVLRRPEDPRSQDGRLLAERAALRIDHDCEASGQESGEYIISHVYEGARDVKAGKEYHFGFQGQISVQPAEHELSGPCRII